MAGPKEPMLRRAEMPPGCNRARTLSNPIKAAEHIVQIKGTATQGTGPNKPIKYVVNTHHHFDHSKSKHSQRTLPMHYPFLACRYRRSIC
jgi:hypothetical protein